MAPHSSTLAWKIPWTEDPGRLQSMGLLRVGHNWASSLSLSLSCIGEGNGNPLQCSLLENPRDGGAWWAVVYGVAQSRTRLKRLSSSSSRSCPTLCNPIDCSLPGSPLTMGFSKQECWCGLPFPFSRGSSWPRDQTWISCIAGRFFTVWATREVVYYGDWVVI